MASPACRARAGGVLGRRHRDVSEDGGREVSGIFRGVLRSRARRGARAGGVGWGDRKHQNTTRGGESGGGRTARRGRPSSGRTGRREASGLVLSVLGRTEAKGLGLFSSQTGLHAHEIRDYVTQQPECVAIEWNSQRTPGPADRSGPRWRWGTLPATMPPTRSRSPRPVASRPAANGPRRHCRTSPSSILITPSNCNRSFEDPASTPSRSAPPSATPHSPPGARQKACRRPTGPGSGTSATAAVSRRPDSGPHATGTRTPAARPPASTAA